jgi:hypothetical protein
MANWAIMACVKETCQHVMGVNDSPFGNKIIVLLGDASIKLSPLWSHFTIHHLHRHRQNAGDIPFANFVDAIGDGAGPDVSLDMLDIVTDTEDIMQFVYPDHMLQDSTSCLTHAILAPTNWQVDQYNDVILWHIHGTQYVYLAADTL